MSIECVPAYKASDGSLHYIESDAQHKNMSLFEGHLDALVRAKLELSVHNANDYIRIMEFIIKHRDYLVEIIQNAEV